GGDDRHIVDHIHGPDVPALTLEPAPGFQVGRQAPHQNGQASTRKYFLPRFDDDQWQTGWCGRGSDRFRMVLLACEREPVATDRSQRNGVRLFAHDWKFGPSEDFY